MASKYAVFSTQIMEIACPFGRLGHPARPKCAAFGRMTLLPML
jgi:hypothetical protein